MLAAIWPLKEREQGMVQEEDAGLLGQPAEAVASRDALQIRAARDAAKATRVLLTGIARPSQSAVSRPPQRRRHGLPQAAPLVDEAMAAALPPPADDASEADASADSDATAGAPGCLNGSWVNQRSSGMSGHLALYSRYIRRIERDTTIQVHVALTGVSGRDGAFGFGRHGWPRC